MMSLEKAALDSIDMTPILGTPDERIERANAFAMKMFRKRNAIRDEIARLRAENERLRAVLEKFADERNWCHSLAGLVEWKAIEFPCQLAADALRGEGGEDGG